MPAQAGIHEVIQIPAGKDSITLGGEVRAGERDRLVISAQRGQYLGLSLESVQNNALFTVMRPGADDSNERQISGQAFAPMADTTRASAQLPDSGQFMVIVGATQGVANYRLRVWLTNVDPAPRQAVTENIVRQQRAVQAQLRIRGELRARLQAQAQRSRSSNAQWAAGAFILLTLLLGAGGYWWYRRCRLPAAARRTSSARPTSAGKPGQR